MKNFILPIISIILFIGFWGCKPDIANDITGDRIKKIKIGMPLKEVISILGKPEKIEALSGIHIIGCPNQKPRFEMNVHKNTDIIHIVDSVYSDSTFCCWGNYSSNIERGQVATLVYAEPQPFINTLSFVVGFDNSYCVNGMTVKKYTWGILDEGWVCFLAEDENSHTSELITNDDLFNQYFP
jgi:hypothetical protein